VEYEQFYTMSAYLLLVLSNGTVPVSNSIDNDSNSVEIGGDTGRSPLEKSSGAISRAFLCIIVGKMFARNSKPKIEHLDLIVDDHDIIRLKVVVNNASLVQIYQRVHHIWMAILNLLFDWLVPTIVYKRLCIFKESSVK